MSDHAKYWWEYEGIGILIHCWWKQKMEQLCWKTIWQSFKDLNMTIIQSSHFTFSYLHKAIKDLCMYICSTFICSSLICNSQNRKQVLFIDSQVDKQTVVCPNTEIPHSKKINKRERTTDIYNIDKSQDNYADWKKPDKMSACYLISIHVKF